MGQRPSDLPGGLGPERLSEIQDLLRFESSISFQSARAHESMWMLVAEVERLGTQLERSKKECLDLAAEVDRLQDVAIGYKRERDQARATLTILREFIHPDQGNACSPFGDGRRYVDVADIERVLNTADQEVSGDD